MIDLVLAFVLGILAGYAVAAVWSARNSVGTIRIDSSDPDGPYLFLELAEPIEKLKNQKSVLVDIKAENYISQE